jgi:CBS-domain-containing membrane protein
VSDDSGPSTAPRPTLLQRLARKLVRWHLLDSKFRHNKARYVAQATVAALCILVVLLVLDSVRQTVLIASLGASSFIAFAVPRSYASRPRALLGGYFVGTLVGCGLSLAVSWAAPSIPLDPGTLKIVGGAVATGLCFFIMATTNTEHPPAAALALGYVLNDWDAGTVLVVFAGIFALSLTKEAVRPKLMDLL